MTDDRDQLVPERLHDAAPGARLVYAALDAHGPAGQEELSAHTGLSPRSIRSIAETLAERDEITVRRTLGDARVREYALADAAPHPDT